MKWLILTCLIFAPMLAKAQISTMPEPAPSVNPIVGNWVYYKKIYQGVEMPQPPDDPVHLHFDFSQEGESHLYWWNEPADLHCDRKGTYHIEGNLLVDRITWVNPENSVGCSSDPDMQVGRETRTPFIIQNDEFFLELHLGNDPLFYVWKRNETRGME